MDVKHLSSIEKVAVLLAGLGEEVAVEIFKHLNELEIKRIAVAMQRLGRIDEQAVGQVFAEFHSIIKQNKRIFDQGQDFAQKLIDRAFSGEKAEELSNHLASQVSRLGQTLQAYDAKTLADTIRSEHPQTIAIILAHVEGKTCGETLKLLPGSLHVEILRRIARLEAVAPETLDEISDFLVERKQNLAAWGGQKIGGVDKVAAILNAMSKDSEQAILAGLTERDTELSQKVREKMFVFEDLIHIEDRGIQELVKVVPAGVWKVALRGAPSDVSDLIFRNMSARAAKMLKEDMLAMAKVKVSDVESARAQILGVAQRLEREGKLSLERNKAQYI